MPEITFIFGPNKTFFFDCPKSWKFHNIPPTLRQLFNSSMNPGWRIAQPFCIALGPQINSKEPIWYCGCRTVNGEEKIFFSESLFEINYPDLSRWTKTIPNAPSACFVTFGPGLSYFACAPGHGSTWAGVSSDLTDKVQKAFDTPSCVSLGMNQAWFVMWPDGYYAWKFYGKYGGLDKILTEAAPRSVSYLSISPYNKEHYFVAFKDQTVKYNFAGAKEWIPQMQEVFKEWEAERTQMQGYLQPSPPAQHQWNQYLPNSGQPAYVAAHYANTPPISELYTPPEESVSPPPQFAAELPGSTLEPPRSAAAARPLSIFSTTSTTKKKRGFFSRKLSRTVEPVAEGGIVKTGPTVASEGSEACTVM